MSNRLISGIYQRGDASAVHYKDTHKARNHWSFVPKNSRTKGKGKRVNVWLHAYDMAHGIGSPADDPLMEMLK